MYLESKMTSTMDQETILPQSHHNHNGKPHIKPVNGGPILSTSSLETVEPANGTRANGSGRELLIVLNPLDFHCLSYKDYISLLFIINHFKVVVSKQMDQMRRRMVQISFPMDQLIQTPLISMRLLTKYLKMEMMGKVSMELDLQI